MTQASMPAFNPAIAPELHHEALSLWLSDLSVECQRLIQDNVNESVSLLRVCALSYFLRSFAVGQPEIIAAMIRTDDVRQRLSAEDYQVTLATIADRALTEGQLIAELRQFRQREFVRIAWRNLMNWSDLSEVMQNLSDFADAVIASTITCLHKWQCKKMKAPKGENGSQQQLMILALGKLGGEELNFSSDIDLVFVAPDCLSAKGSDEHTAFFLTLAQTCIRVLSSQTDLGIVFRVDMRLRPFGDAGPLVVSLSQLQHYFIEHGREWERYAYVKARVICGSHKESTALTKMINEFVYHPYLDYSTIDSLRAMKKLIDREIIKKKLQSDIKRGPGGIRQVEFIAQTYQLIHGGNDPAFQQRRLLPVIDELVRHGCLSAEVGLRLSDGYCYLRNLEHRLQMYKDQQTHKLPNDEMEQLRLANAMGSPTWQALQDDLTGHRDFIHAQYEHLLDKPQHSSAGLGEYCSIEINKQWLAGFEEEAVLGLLDEVNIPQCSNAFDMLSQFRTMCLSKSLSECTWARLSSLMPIFLPLLGQIDNPIVTLERCLNLFERCLAQPAYLSIFLEKPIALERLLRLFSKSAWVASTVHKHPFLLDQFIIKQTLQAPKSEQQLEDSLRQLLLPVPDDNIDEQLELLRSFKLRQIIQVAMADIEGTLPIMKVSDHLTFTATVILRQVHRLALKECMSQSPVDSPYQEQDIVLAIVAYGKLGGIELSYESDLDLVFLHQSDAQYVPIVTRLSQRIIQMCTTHMNHGILYPIDTRLRPSGEAGLLATSLSAFEIYQKQEAWTWEHQALVRARVISENETFIKHFNRIRKEVLCHKREKDDLKNEILEMRNKMIAGSSHASASNKKGSITDIEFIVQYSVLAAANRFPQLSVWTDNVRILETIEAVQLMTREQVTMLTRAYTAFRFAVHHTHLALTPSHEQEMLAYQLQIEKMWESIFL